MQIVSKDYRKSMKNPLRNRGYVRATIGVINSDAQNSVEINESKTKLAYFSTPENAFKNTIKAKVYATAEQNYSKVDGSMYFLPDKGSASSLYKTGIITEGIEESIYISFGEKTNLEIKGLTINFGESYPTKFSVENENVFRVYENDSELWSTEDVFEGTSYFIIRPINMVNGKCRLRIYEFYSGIVNAFGNGEIIKCSVNEYVSPTSETIPSIDTNLIVENQDQYYNPDNPESALAYMEVGQEIKIQFGCDVSGNGDIEWLEEQTTYLQSWSATDTQAEFNSTDQFYKLTKTYYGGFYRKSGITLYDLAAEVLEDAGISEEKYKIDKYLKDVKVYNPLPVCTYAEALQIIANAGRCVLFQDRSGRIHIKSSFVPKMTSESNSEEKYSNSRILLLDKQKKAYALTDNNYSKVDGSMYFLPDKVTNDESVYTSKSIWYESEENALGTRLSYRLGNYLGRDCVTEFGEWHGEIPKITIKLESGYTAYGLLIKFTTTAPKEFYVKTYYDGLIVQQKIYRDSDVDFMTDDTFELFDEMVIEFTKGYPNSRISIDKIMIGDISDYELDRQHLTTSARSTRAEKTKSISVSKNIYKDSYERDLINEEIEISEEGYTHTSYFTQPVYGLSVVVEDSDIVAEIIEYSSHFAKVRFSGAKADTILKYTIKGCEYDVTEVKYTQKYNETGEEIEWNNPLISDSNHAKNVEEWLATYYIGEVFYEINWRGDPRTDANDLFYLWLKNGERVMIRGYQNETNFNGAWSGSIKARRAVL